MAQAQGAKKEVTLFFLGLESLKICCLFVGK